MKGRIKEEQSKREIIRKLERGDRGKKEGGGRDGDGE